MWSTKVQETTWTKKVGKDICKKVEYQTRSYKNTSWYIARMLDKGVSYYIELVEAPDFALSCFHDINSGGWV